MITWMCIPVLSACLVSPVIKPLSLLGNVANTVAPDRFAYQVRTTSLLKNPRAQGKQVSRHSFPKLRPNATICQVSPLHPILSSLLLFSTMKSAKPCATRWSTLRDTSSWASRPCLPRPSEASESSKGLL